MRVSRSVGRLLLLLGARSTGPRGTAGCRPADGDTRLLGIARREEQEPTLLLGVLDDPASFRGQLIKIIYSGT